MAATLSYSKTVLAVPFGVYEWKLSGLTSGHQETLTYSDFQEQTPDWLEMCVVTPATDQCNISMDWVSTTASSSQVVVRLRAEQGASLEGAAVKIRAHFFATAQGGISA